MNRQSLLLPLFLTLVLQVQAQTATLKVAVDKPGHPVSPTLYGIFFEDINCSADGGLYAELVRNRNFEDSERPEHWQTLDPTRTEISIGSSQPVSEKNPQFLVVRARDVAGGRAGIVNEGFWGIGLKQGEVYQLSFFARGDGGFSGPLQVSLESSTGEVLASAKVPAMRSCGTS